MSPKRSEEFETLLYKNARDQIDQKFSAACQHAGMSHSCPAIAASG